MPDNNLSQAELDDIAPGMDSNIREEMHFQYKPGFDNPAEFFDEYCRRHKAAFGEDFVWE